MCGDEDATLEAAENENEDTPADGAAIQDCSVALEASSSSRCKKKKKKKKKQKNEESKEQNGMVHICTNIYCIYHASCLVEYY